MVHPIVLQFEADRSTCTVGDREGSFTGLALGVVGFADGSADGDTVNVSTRGPRLGAAVGDPSCATAATTSAQQRATFTVVAEKHAVPVFCEDPMASE